MIHVFQFYKKHWRIPKPYYTTETRQAFQNWEKKIISHVGFVNCSELVLPVEKKGSVQLNRTEGIIIQDVPGYKSAKAKLLFDRNTDRIKLPKWYKDQQRNSMDSQNPEIACFNIEIRIWNFEIFSIEKNEDKEFEVFLRYKSNEFYIGEPVREDHKLCVLRKNEPVKILINGKSDFTMTGRQERLYSEYEYIIEYLGEIDAIEYRELNKIEIEKEIPETFAKHIDLRKVLY